MPAQTVGRIGGSAFVSKKAAAQTVVKKQEPASNTVLVQTVALPTMEAISYSHLFSKPTTAAPSFDGTIFVSVLALHIFIVWILNRTQP